MLLQKLGQGLRKRAPGVTIRLLQQQQRHKALSAPTALEETTEHIYETSRSLEEMPGPRCLPLIGTKWMHLPGGPLHGMVWYEKVCKLQEMYGNAIREEVVPGVNLVHLFDPADFETIYRSDGKYPVRDSFFMLKKYNEKYNNNIQGIATSHGGTWHRLRSQVQGKMLKPKAVAAYIEDQESVANDFVERIRELRDPDDVIHDILPYLYKFSSESIGVVCFNKRVGALDRIIANGSECDQFIKAVNDVMAATHSEMNSLFLFQYFDTPMFKKLTKAQSFIREISLSYSQDSVDRVRNAGSNTEVDGEHADLIPYLMTKSNLSEEEIMTLISEFFFAGVDTTSYLLGFAMYALSKYPDVQEKLREEIDRVVPENSPVTEASLKTMPYLRAFLKETLRFTPVAPGNSRTVSCDVVLSGYTVPAGTILALHHDWAGKTESNCQDAHKFLPERWMRSENRCSLTPFAYMPFGFGARSCPGRRLAEQEVSLALIKILQNFRIEYCHKTDLVYDICIINKPVTPLKFRFTART